MKAIVLTPSQIKAKEADATMFIIPIEISNFCKDVGNTLDDIEKCFISNNALTYSIYFRTDYRQTSEIPIQVGDKNIFVKEEFLTYSNKSCLTYNPKLKLLEGIKYRRDALEDRYNEGDYPFDLDYCWQRASQMTKEQSRYLFEECISIKIIRIQDIPTLCIPKITARTEMLYTMYNQQMKEQGINRTYEDNDYVFLIEFK